MDYDDYSYGCSSYGDDTVPYDEASYEGYENYTEDVYQNKDFDFIVPESNDEYYLDDQDSLSSHTSNPPTHSQSHIKRTYDSDDSDDTEILVTNKVVTTSSTRHSYSLQHNNADVTKKLPFFEVIRGMKLRDVSSAKIFL